MQLQMLKSIIQKMNIHCKTLLQPGSRLGSLPGNGNQSARQVSGNDERLISSFAGCREDALAVRNQQRPAAMISFVSSRKNGNAMTGIEQPLP